MIYDDGTNDCEACGRADNDGVLIDSNGDRHPYCHRHRDEIIAAVEAIDAPTRDHQANSNWPTPAQALANMHKAEPKSVEGQHYLPTTYECRHCNGDIHQVPGGSGPVWVHADGYVTARNDDAPPPAVATTYSFTITAQITGTDRQDAWDKWCEWLTEPSNVEAFTQVQQEGLVFVSEPGRWPS